MSGLPRDFMAGGGEMGSLMRSRDWSTTPIGAPATWSQGLRTAVRLALSSRHPMFIWWGPRLIQFYNDAYRQTMGPEKHPAALGGSGYDWWPEAWSIIGPQIECVMAGGPATWHEDQVVPNRRHGSDKAVYWTYGFSPIDDELAPHGIGGVLVVCRDVTEEHRLRETLANERADERRRRLTIESAVDYAIITLDPDGLVTDWNTGAERILGWSAEEMRGRPTDRFFTPQDRAENRAGGEMRQTLQNGSVGAERRYLRRDGSEFWASGEMMLMKDEAGAHLGFTKILRDITERKQAEATLHAFNATLERQVEERTRERDQLWRMPNLLLAIAGFDATIRAVNPAWTTLLGWSEGELVGQCYADFIHPDDAGRSLDWAARCAAGETVEALENRYRRKAGGYLPIGWTIMVGDGVFHCTGRDVSGDREQAALRERLEEQLRQSQKMEAVGQLTGGLAHDFNNLLTGVTGSLELMQTRIAQGRIEDVDRYINAAQGAAKRAAALTHRLLAFSRQQTLDPKPTDLDRLVAGMEDMIRRTVGPGITVERPAATGALWSTLVDAGQLENALLNLCINARDAMPDGGKITIETDNTWLDEPAAQERELVAGPYVMLCVTDTGTGMPPETVARAFDPFFTTKPIGKGTGLGLSMIYGFARQSGGAVCIASELSQGTAVCLHLPRHFGTEVAAELPPAVAETPRAALGETVLIVDDEPTVRMLVVEILEDLGYTAIAAADGAAGLEVLQSDVRIDLLVTDVGLPGGMNGRQVADAARVARPDLKVLFITGFAESAVLSHGQLEPGMHIMTKPFAMEGLTGRIKDLIAG